jgi:hypothetical protein
MTMSSRFLLGALSSVVVLSGVACGRQDTDGPPSSGAATASTASTNSAEPALPAAAIAALDAGNVAYRAKEFDAALAKYREAALAAPQHAAPWFGIYMVANDVKNVALADSAMARVKSLSADPAALDAHVEVSNAKTNGVPSGHPSTTIKMPSGQPSTQALPPGHPTPAAPASPHKIDSSRKGRAL